MNHMPYSYDNRKRNAAGKSWGEAIGKFEKTFRNLLTDDVPRALAPKVEKALKELQKDLGPNWEYVRSTPKEIAGKLLRNVLDAVVNSDSDFSWALDNTIANYLPLEQMDLGDLTEELEPVMEKELKDFLRKHVRGATVTKEDTWAGRITFRVKFPEDAKPSRDVDEDVEQALRPAIAAWCKKKDIPAGMARASLTFSDPNTANGMVIDIEL